MAGASAPELSCSFAAGVAGIEQLYSMPELASEDGEHPGACRQTRCAADAGRE
jgi:hypothetical protein